MSIKNVISVYINGLSRESIVISGLLFGILFVAHLFVYKNDYFSAALLTTWLFAILLSFAWYGDRALKRFKEKKYFYFLVNSLCSFISLLAFAGIFLTELGVI